VFSATMTYLVFSPSWNIPHNLAVQDKLPEVRKDPGYFGKMGIRVYQGWGADAKEIDPAAVDWTQVGRGNFPYRLRQEPGPLNALGRVKFMFPNKFNVYIHDTPGRELFAQSERSFSSGCIRTEKPLELAALLLADDPEWDSGRIAAAAASNREQTVTLPRPVPVHLLYWTAWAEENGGIHFRKDIYDRDGAMVEAMARPPVPARGAPGEGL
jgi:murein L,D-transpeptidase YcbB/YkuD